jgi:two-component system, OmpR family, sensor kinase
MTRHFLGLYLLIVMTLAAVSWGQDELLQRYNTQEAPEEKASAAVMTAVQDQLRGVPQGEWRQRLADMATRYGLDMDLFAATDIVGSETVTNLKLGKIAQMQGSAGQSWTLKQLDTDHVLALKSVEPRAQRGALDWVLTATFYAAIALVIMIWIWPLRRDLRVLERAAARFGDRNWEFEPLITQNSQIHPLAETFRKMAARIDGLIASHKDMSNAVSHEIRTPLSRMQFEIELAQQALHMDEVKKSFGNIKADIAAINDLITATLDYAILERADVALNLGVHNFTTLIPAIADNVQRDARSGIQVRSDVQPGADQIVCDVHLMEAVLRNLLYNAIRFAKRDIQVTFRSRDGVNQLTVDDDGPGIPEKDRQRVFDSFVQLERVGARKMGFGLGLAIVKRAVEWHRGAVSVSKSPLGGARFLASWPAVPVSG